MKNGITETMENIDMENNEFFENMFTVSSDTEDLKEENGLDSLLDSFADNDDDDDIISAQPLDIAQLMKDAKEKALESILQSSSYESLGSCVRIAKLQLKENGYDDAIKTCKSGLEKYGDDPILLSILLRAYAESGDLKSAENIFSTLQKISFKKFKFEVFSGINDYLLLNAYANKALIKKNIKRCKTTLPGEERAFVLESELWSKLKKRKREKRALLKAIKKHKSALNCAVNLQILQVEDIEFEKALKTGYYSTFLFRIEPPDSILFYVIG